MSFEDTAITILVMLIFAILFIIFILYLMWYFIKSAVYRGTKQALSEELKKILVETGNFEYTDKYVDIGDVLVLDKKD